MLAVTGRNESLKPFADGMLARLAEEASRAAIGAP
jgi:hypothetical protein